MPNFNSVILMGHIVAEPEPGETPSGSNFLKGSIAVTEKWTDSNGDKKEDTSFFNWILWGKRCAPFEQYVHKGDPILLQGRLKQERWQNNEGQNRSKVLLKVFDFQFIPRREKPVEDAKMNEEPSTLDVGNDEVIPF